VTTLPTLSHRLATSRSAIPASNMSLMSLGRWLRRHRVSSAVLICAAGCLFIALVLTASITAVTLRYKSELSEAARELRTLDLLLAGEADRSLLSVGLVLESVSDEVTAGGVSSADDLLARSSTRALNESLQTRVAGLPQIDSLTILDAEGNIINDTRGWPVRGGTAADQSYFQVARNWTSAQPYLSEPVIDRYSGQRTIYLARRLTTPEGRFLGLVVGSIRLSYFERFYSSLELADDGCVAIWRHDGTMITHYSPVLEGKKLLFGLVRPTAPWYGVTGVFEAAPTADDPTGVPRILATSETPNFPLQVLIGRSKPALLENWRREATAIGGAAGFAILATVLLLWTVLRRMRMLEEATIASREREQAVIARKDAEDTLRQAQKIDSIGHLTGGIAHDFGNMLGIISTNLTVIQKKLEKGNGDVEKQLGAAQDGVRRASSLTQRLLGFTQKQPVEIVSVDVNGLISGFSDLLERTLASNIRFRMLLEIDLMMAHGNISQLENAILNLAVNARDAMPEGGVLTVQTKNKTLSYADCQALNIEPGAYATISVSDSGTGMSAEVQARAFEPFFTTKDSGKGTGLGLSQVAVFVKTCGGGLQVDSEPGAGTTVTLYLPQAKSDARQERFGTSYASVG
jgi:signal transduction histidine kinase